jgi:hypothetical protein
LTSITRWCFLASRLRFCSDEIESLLPGNCQRSRRRHDPELLPGLVDYADFSNTNAFVGANAVVTSGRTIESDTAS